MSWHALVSIVFGLFLAITTTLAWFSGVKGIKLISSLVAVPYAVSVLSYFGVGPGDEPWFDLVSFAATGSLMAICGAFYGGRLPYILFVTYILSLCVVAAAFFSDTQGSGLYFPAINALFVVRMLVVGGVAVHALGRRNARYRSHRFSHASGGDQLARIQKGRVEK